MGPNEKLGKVKRPISDSEDEYSNFKKRRNFEELREVEQSTDDHLSQDADLEDDSQDSSCLSDADSIYFVPDVKTLKTSKSNEVYEYDKETVLSKLKDSMLEIEASPFFDEAVTKLTSSITTIGKSMKDVDKIIVYALGSTSSLCGARVHANRECSLLQLCFISLVAKKFQFPKDKVEFFDPIFTEIDKFIITDFFGYKLLDSNEVGQRKVDKLTIFYLPRAPYLLANGVLHANWTMENLQNVVMVTSDFKTTLTSEYVEETVGSELEVSYIRRIVDGCSISEMTVTKNNVRNTETNEYYRAFNDEAFIVFPKKCLLQCIKNYEKKSQQKSNKNMMGKDKKKNNIKMSHFWALDLEFEEAYGEFALKKKEEEGETAEEMLTE